MTTNTIHQNIHVKELVRESVNCYSRDQCKQIATTGLEKGSLTSIWHGGLRSRFTVLPLGPAIGPTSFSWYRCEERTGNCLSISRAGCPLTWFSSFIVFLFRLSLQLHMEYHFHWNTINNIIINMYYSENKLKNCINKENTSLNHHKICLDFLRKQNAKDPPQHKVVHTYLGSETFRQ